MHGERCGEHLVESFIRSCPVDRYSYVSFIRKICLCWRCQAGCGQKCRRYYYLFHIAVCSFGLNRRKRILHQYKFLIFRGCLQDVYRPRFKHETQSGRRIWAGRLCRLIMTRRYNISQKLDSLHPNNHVRFARGVLFWIFFAIPMNCSNFVGAFANNALNQ